MIELMKVKPEVPNAPVEKTVQKEVFALNYDTLEQFNNAVNSTEPEPVDGAHWKITDIDFWVNEIWVTWTLPAPETEHIEWNKKLKQYHADMEVWKSQTELRRNHALAIQRENKLKSHMTQIERLERELKNAKDAYQQILED